MSSLNADTGVPDTGRHGGIWYPAAILGAIVTLAYFNIVFLGQTLVASSNYHPFDYRWDVIKAGHSQGRAFTNWYDLGGVWWQWEPAGSFFSKEYRNGHVPLWDPYVGGGVDAHVQLVQGQYYPPYVLLLLLGNKPILRDAYYLIELLVAGWFLYRLLRDHGCAFLSGITAATAYMLSGALTQTINSILGQTFVLLPVMVWAAAYVIRRPEWRRAAVAGFVLGLCGLSSFMPIVISGYVLFGLYVCTHICINQRTRMAWKTASVSAITIVVSFGLIAFLLVPFLSASAHDPAFSQWYRDIGLQAYPVDTLLTLASPSISFDQWQGGGPQLFQDRIGFFYVGLAVIMLAAMARPGKTEHGRRMLFWYFLVSGGLVLFKLLGVPPVQWIAYLPVFNNLHFVPYFCGALALSVAGLAGLGVEAILRGEGRSALVSSVIVLAAFLVLVMRFDLSEPVNPSLEPTLVGMALTRQGFDLLRLIVIGLALIAVVLLRGRLGEGRAAKMLIVVLLLDLVPLAYRTRFQRSDVWNHVPSYVRFLQNDKSGSRVHAVHDLALTPNVGEGVGVRVISARQPINSSRFFETIKTYFEVQPLPYPLVRGILPTNRAVLNVLSIKHLILYSPTPVDAEKMKANGLEIAAEDGLFRIYRNPDAFPQAYIARNVHVAGSGADSLSAIGGMQAGDAVVEDLPLPGGMGTGSIENFDDGVDSIRIRAHADGPAVLVLNENFAPGWHATVNGRPAQIGIANHSFQAVQIPAGVSETRFDYLPEGFRAGLSVSLCFAVGSVPLIVLPLWRRKR